MASGRLAWSEEAAMKREQNKMVEQSKASLESEHQVLAASA